MLTRTAGSNHVRPASADGVVKVFTDGSSHGNPGEGGWAWFVNKSNFKFGASPSATNQRMELEAIRDALASLPRTLDVEILTDSEFSVNAFTKWVGAWARSEWKKKDGSSIANGDVIAAVAVILVERERAKSKTVFTHIRSHCGVVNNEVCDKLANAAATMGRGGGPGWSVREVFIPSAAPARGSDPARKSSTKPGLDIVGELCPSCGRQINPLTQQCGCFRD